MNLINNKIETCDTNHLKEETENIVTTKDDVMECPHNKLNGIQIKYDSKKQV